MSNLLVLNIFRNVGWNSEGLAYNIITVGAFDDRNTIRNREKPEVTAPGSNIMSTTTASPWYGNIGSGTSYAAPMVTGVAADIEKNIPPASAEGIDLFNLYSHCRYKLSMHIQKLHMRTFHRLPRNQNR